MVQRQQSLLKCGGKQRRWSFSSGTHNTFCWPWTVLLRRRWVKPSFKVCPSQNHLCCLHRLKTLQCIVNTAGKVISASLLPLLESYNTRPSQLRDEHFGRRHPALMRLLLTSERRHWRNFLHFSTFSILHGGSEKKHILILCISCRYGRMTVNLTLTTTKKS